MRVVVTSGGLALETRTQWQPHDVPADGMAPPIRLENVRLSTGLASEADTASARGVVRLRAAGLASEADTAYPAGGAANVGGAAIVRPVGAALEADTATTLGVARLRAVGVALEADTAAGLAWRRVVALGMAIEADTARHVRTGPPTPIGTRRIQLADPTVATLARSSAGVTFARAPAARSSFVRLGPVDGEIASG